MSLKKLGYYKDKKNNNFLSHVYDKNDKLFLSFPHVILSLDQTSYKKTHIGFQVFAYKRSKKDTF